MGVGQYGDEEYGAEGGAEVPRYMPRYTLIYSLHMYTSRC